MRHRRPWIESEPEHCGANEYVAQPVTEGTIHCPHCGVETPDIMPTNACVRFWECPACRALVKPKPGDCCVFCSYGTMPCPPRQR